MNLVFLVDASSNLDSRDFVLTRDFLVQVSSNLDVGFDRVNVALVKYASSADVMWFLHDITAIFPNDLQIALRDLAHVGGPSMTSRGLFEATEVFYYSDRIRLENFLQARTSYTTIANASIKKLSSLIQIHCKFN